MAGHCFLGSAKASDSSFFAKIFRPRSPHLACQRAGAAAALRVSAFSAPEPGVTVDARRTHPDTVLLCASASLRQRGLSRRPFFLGASAVRLLYNFRASGWRIRRSSGSKLKKPGEEARFHLLRCGRRPPQRRERSPPGHRAPGTPLGGAHGQPPGGARSARRFPEADRAAPSGRLQPHAQEGMDARLAPAHQSDARHPAALPSRAGAPASPFLAGEPAGDGRLARAELQPRALGGSRRRHAAGDDPHRYRRLPAPFLDRAAAPVFHLRLGARGSAGARDQPPGFPHFPRLRHDPKPAFL